MLKLKYILYKCLIGDMMARLYGQKENIDTETVKNFFDSRAEKKVDSLLAITSFHEEDNLKKRQDEDLKIILENMDLSGKKIFEIGCGVGRWAEIFHDKCDQYLGIDYSKNLIDIANKNYQYDNCYFQEMSAVDIDVGKLLVKPPFDIILITGVLLFFNDEDFPKMIKCINDIMSENKIIYIRETISLIDERLTLKDFYSEDLKTDYNAIYRTKEEFLELFKDFNNISEIKSGSIFEELRKFDETGYQYFVLK